MGPPMGPLCPSGQAGRPAEPIRGPAQTPHAGHGPRRRPPRRDPGAVAAAHGPHAPGTPGPPGVHRGGHPGPGPPGHLRRRRRRRRRRRLHVERELLRDPPPPACGAPRGRRPRACGDGARRRDGGRASGTRVVVVATAEPPLRRRDSARGRPARGDGRGAGWWSAAGCRRGFPRPGPPRDPPPPPWNPDHQPKVNCGAGLPGSPPAVRRVVAARGVETGEPRRAERDAAGEGSRSRSTCAGRREIFHFLFGGTINRSGSHWGGGR